MLALLVAGTGGLSACGEGEGDASDEASFRTSPTPVPADALLGPTWTVTDLYTSPDSPSALPAALEGTVTLNVGDSSAVITTGCAQLQAASTVADGRLRLDSVDASPVDPASCTGQQQVIHDTMRELFASGSIWVMSERSSGEVVLTLDSEQLDPPAVRLAAL